MGGGFLCLGIWTNALWKEQRLALAYYWVSPYTKTNLGLSLLVLICLANLETAWLRANPHSHCLIQAAVHMFSVSNLLECSLNPMHVLFLLSIAI